jgi:hypothetical protein
MALLMNDLSDEVAHQQARASEKKQIYFEFVLTGMKKPV